MAKEPKEYTVDAEGRRLGRLATEIATILQGKDDPSFRAHQVSNVKVRIKNIEGIEISGKKAQQKIYHRHSGRLGHLKKTTYSEAFNKDPEWVLKHAVRLMLPKNRLAKKIIQNIIIENKQHGG